MKGPFDHKKSETCKILFFRILYAENSVTEMLNESMRAARTILRRATKRNVVRAKILNISRNSTMKLPNQLTLLCLFLHFQHSDDDPHLTTKYQSVFL
jgi:hypothetical protein